MNSKEKVLFSAWFLKFYCDVAGCSECPLRTHGYRCILFTRFRRKPFRWDLPEYKGPPITDVTAVVRCSDCCKYHSFGNGYGECSFFGRTMKDSEFCSNGLKK